MDDSKKILKIKLNTQILGVSIVILNYNQIGFVRQCIKGIIHSYPRVSYEIIVVDNNSTQRGIADLGNEFPKIKIIHAEKNFGMGAGNNLGIQKSTGKYIMVLNPDTVMTHEVIDNLFGYMEKNQKIGIISPKLIYPDGTLQHSARRFHSFLTPFLRRTFLGKLPFAKKHIDLYLMNDFDYAHEIPVDWLFGACFFIRKEYLMETGYFDERFFMYFEDCDLCRRFWEKGYEVWYYPRVEIVHYHQQQSAEKNGIFSLLNKAGRIHITSGIKYFAKYLGAKNPRNA